MADALNILTLTQSNGRCRYRVAKGGYTLDGGLTLAIEARLLPERKSRAAREDEDEDMFRPDMACLNLIGHPLQRALKAGDRFAGVGGMQHDAGWRAMASAYFEDHCENVCVVCTVVTVGRGRLRVRIAAVHDDVENYGSGQVPSRTHGTVELKLTSPAKLWDPTGTLDRISEEESEAEMERIREDAKEEAGTDRYRGNADIDARAAERRLRRIVEYVEEKALPADLARVQIALVAKYGLLSEKTIAGFMKLKPPGSSRRTHRSRRRNRRRSNCRAHGT